MKATEILKIGHEILKLMSELDLRVDDYKFLGMKADYDRMRNNREKVDYINAFLSYKYKVSESTVKRIIRRLSKEVNS